MSELQTPGRYGCTILGGNRKCAAANDEGGCTNCYCCRYPLFIIGPEGTTKHSSYMLQFSTGAFVGGHPVLPVLLKYRCRCMNVLVPTHSLFCRLAHVNHCCLTGTSMWAGELSRAWGGTLPELYHNL